MLFLWFFFFFKQKTAYEMRISDWSSDVCSSDLSAAGDRRDGVHQRLVADPRDFAHRLEELLAQRHLVGGDVSVGTEHGHAVTDSGRRVRHGADDRGAGAQGLGQGRDCLPCGGAWEAGGRKSGGGGKRGTVRGESG